MYWVYVYTLQLWWPNIKQNFFRRQNNFQHLYLNEPKVHIIFLN